MKRINASDETKKKISISLNKFNKNKKQWAIKSLFQQDQIVQETVAG